VARFFIDRPIFAWVIAIIIMLAGLASIFTLPLEQYPDIAPPVVNISATYPGASAKTVEDSVTQVIEQAMTGIDHLLYMTSTSNSSGGASVRLTFDAGTNPDVAQMQVQNKLQQAMPRLPQAVQTQGVIVNKSNVDILMLVSLISNNPKVTAIDIGDFINSTVIDQISRLDGVGEVTSIGAGYAMRVWMDPAKLVKYNLMPSDVNAAILAQNTQVSAGQLGDVPATPGQQLNATITARSKLTNVDQFNNIVLKSEADGSTVRLKDVARVELGASSYSPRTRFSGEVSAAMMIRLSSDANALGTADAVKAKMKELEAYYPTELKLETRYGYDTTPFVRISIEEVVKTLIEAIALVVLIMFVFLQEWRATLIPAIAVPVVLLGTFGVLAAFGFTINTLTMFALVLAIGLLVDDAIVVVENVERVMREEKLPPKAATRRSMDEITGALIGIAMVLSAVFIPMAFFGGSTGVIYRQFSITIVSAMLLSVLVALVLTPALCATLLKPASDHHPHQRRGFFGWFNRTFDRSSAAYQTTVRGIIARKFVALLVYGGIAVVLALLFHRLPTSFLPDEDQGTLRAEVQLPVGATDYRTRQAMQQVEDYFLKKTDAVESIVTIIGSGQSGNSQNVGRAFIKLRDWSERTDPSKSAAVIASEASRDLSAMIRDAKVFVMMPPSVRGLGQSAGFTMELRDLGGRGHEALMAARNQFLELAKKDPRLDPNRVRATGLEDTPQFQVDIDDEKAGAFKLTTDAVNSTLSLAMGGDYVNDFVHNGRVKKVYVQADAPFRMAPENIGEWYARNGNGEMVPFAMFSNSYWTFGSPLLERYNGISAVEIVGEAAPDVSSGDAMNAVEELVKELPEGFGVDWTQASYQERLSGSQAPLLYAISILFVFLCLAALYESWAVPFSVILIVPLGIIGAVLTTTLRGMSADVYFQVGLLTTVGLAAKNAILIVEFAKHLQEQGKSLMDATMQAVRQRLRPILMTSLAFLFGVLPLALSTGAGAASRRAIGTGVLGGMLTATVFGIFFVPLFYMLIRTLFPYKPDAEQIHESQHG
jgi:HAE1 family hydrophobic/amphiphilic exporter-1/multidrug efflux pump